MFVGLETVAWSHTNLVTEPTKLLVSNNQSPRVYGRNTEAVLTKCQEGSFSPKFRTMVQKIVIVLLSSNFYVYLRFIHVIF